MAIKQLTVFVENKQGALVSITDTLAANDINLRALSIADTTKYGIDIYGKPILDKLLHELSKIEGIKWIRFLYSYPEGITEELIKEVINSIKY